MIFGSFLYFFIVTIALVKSSNQKQNKTTIVQANHFYSDYQLFTTYNVGQLSQKYALSVVIKPKTQNSTYENRINMTLKSGNSENSCAFKNYFDLCVLNSIDNSHNTTMKVQCQKLPCEIFFTIYQSKAIQKFEKQQLQDLYQIEEIYKHVILNLKCDNPNLVNYDKDIKIYSSKPYERRVYKNTIQVIFNRAQKGYLYVQAKSEAKSCTKMKISKIKEEIQFNEPIKDFIQNVSNIYHLKRNPENDMRIDFSFHDFDKLKVTENNVVITLKGEKQSQITILSLYNISNVEKKIIVYFNVLFRKALFENHKNLMLDIMSPQGRVSIQFFVREDKIQQIDPDELSYFSLKKDEMISYQLQPNSDDDLKNVTVQLSDPNKVEADRNVCKLTQGCIIRVKAIDNVQGTLILRNSDIKIQKQKDIQYIEVLRRYTSKIRQNQIQYFIHKAKGKSELQFTINSANVIVYIGDQKCPAPSSQCFNYSGNHRNPIYIQEQLAGDLYIAVVALDDARFTLRVDENENQYIILHDGEPFTYTLNKQKSMKLAFLLKKETDVEFNLIAPLNTLVMYVNNEMEIYPTSEKYDYKSTQGFIAIKKKQLVTKQLIIVIEKVNQKIQLVHFTLIASTSKSIIHLQPSLSHYETLRHNTPKVYILEYHQQMTSILNVYSYGVPEGHVNISLQISNKLQTLNSSNKIQIEMIREILQIKEISDELCEQNVQCEIYIRLTNNLQTQIDLVLTYMSQNSIIELKDGIWQSYALTVTTSSTFFYFIPKHPNNTINIIYNSTFKNLTIAYSLFNLIQQTLNPSNWPFPVVNSKDIKRDYNPVKQISISAQNLKKCWPHCVVLFSLVGLDKDSITDKAKFELQRVNDFFNIMATNDMIELMQHEKLELVIHEKQQKEIIIDLKNFMQKEQLTFFISCTIGTPRMFASVASANNMRTPTAQQYDFGFGRLETQIKLSSIKKKLQDLKMQNDQQIILKLVIIPILQTKLQIEFSASQNLMKQINYESFESVILQGETTRVLQFVPTQDYTLKIIRIQGLPFIKVQVCKLKQIEECLGNMNHLEQMASKTDTYSGKASLQQILFIKIEAKQKVQVDLYVQSTYGQLQIKQGVTITDFSPKSVQTRYLITTLREKQTVITIHVIEGNPMVNIKNEYGFQVNATKKQNNLIHVKVPPSSNLSTQVDSGLIPSHTSSFSLNSRFQHIHVLLSDQQSNSTYTISYTTGQRGIELQDGLLSKVLIESGSKVTFFYVNPSKQILLNVILTFQNVKQLQSCSIKLSYFNENSQQIQQNIPSVPEMKKKTPHPTLLFQMPVGYEYHEIQVSTNETYNISVSIVINQNELMVLPYDVQFPIVLKQNDGQYFITQVANEGYLYLIIRKCNDGVPTISYTFDYNLIQKDEFTFQTQIKQEMREQIFIKAQIGVLYMKLISQTSVTFSIEIKYFQSKDKIPKNNVKLNNNGLLDYQLINSIQSEITIPSVKCANKCKVTYSYISSTNSKNLYSQLICPSHFFNFSDPSPQLTFKKIQTTTDSNQPIKFLYQLEDQISYIGVKATLQDGREYFYKPLEIVTIWGHIARNQRYHNFIIFIIIASIMCCLWMILRSRKRGYSQLRDEDS